MNRPLVGWVILWSGLLLTAVSARHAEAYFADSLELTAIHGGDPAPVPITDGNGWCSSATCDCRDKVPFGYICWHDVATNTCHICVPPAEGTTQYLCCQGDGNLGNQKNCVLTNTTAQCGIKTSTPANPNAPWCEDNNNNGICRDHQQIGDPACWTYQTVDEAKSTPCDP